jgi:hypothetical protein
MSRWLGLGAAALLACALVLTGLPATVAAPPPTVRASEPAPGDRHEITFHGDVVHAFAGARRRPRTAWPGRRIYFRETIPAKWDWSLSRALQKWNQAGGGIRLVRTTSRKKARLTISYGNIGAAAGMATIGRTRHAWVRLSRTYASADPYDTRNRIEVMAIFAHELGHVLGFGHTRAPCSLMGPVLDVVGCGMVPAERPGYYACRTLDAALVRRFVRIYGGRARHPAPWCLIEALPPSVAGVSLVGGPGGPALRWDAPTRVVDGWSVRIRSWPADPAADCDQAPGWASSEWVPVTAGLWSGSAGAGASCLSAQLVNRYGAGRAPVVRAVESTTLTTVEESVSGP